MNTKKIEKELKDIKYKLENLIKKQEIDLSKIDELNTRELS